MNVPIVTCAGWAAPPAMAELSESEDEGSAHVAPAAERIRSVWRAASRWLLWQCRR